MSSDMDIAATLTDMVTKIADYEMKQLDAACERALRTGEPDVVHIVYECDGNVLDEKWHIIVPTTEQSTPLHRYEAKQLLDFPDWLLLRVCDVLARELR